MMKIFKFLIISAFPLFSSQIYAQKVEAPEELKTTIYSNKDLTPTPACLSAAPDGTLFVGVDGYGSLGKGPGKGKIIRLVDENHDGVADRHTVFAKLDNPRGLMAVGDKVFVLHTKWKNTKEFIGMYLSVLEDKDQDGVADGPPKKLIKDISCKLHNQRRGADHTTNGIRMGIDGWIYIAIGDFGMVGAKGTDGRSLDMLGGGIIRVRPDGTEMETYVHGLRNIYDIAIDPFMNVYTWGNTNDGGGWNIRFIHEIQSGQYGYPILFKRFTNEVLPALVDAGGGSGTGSMFFQEPGWPEKYNNVPLMGDWGRSQVIIVRLTKDGASFQQSNEKYLGVKKFTDIDVDGTGQMYVGSWSNAGYRGGNAGWVGRIVPKGWSYKPFPNLKKESVKNLVTFLRKPSATWRLHASQALVTRNDKSVTNELQQLIKDKSASAESRVAAIYTYKQLFADKANEALILASSDRTIREHCLRAVTDRETQLGNTKPKPFVVALNDKDPRVQVAAAVSLGRLGDRSTAKDLLKKAGKLCIPLDKYLEPAKNSHATPNSESIVPHISRKALHRLNAIEIYLKSLGSELEDAALSVLRTMHDQKVSQGLIQKLKPANEKSKIKIIEALARLYHKEAKYDGSWWWGTRPDTRGPYYKLATWEGSAAIKDAIVSEWKQASQPQKGIISYILTYNRVAFPEIGNKVEIANNNRKKRKKEPKVNLKKIQDKKGQVGKMAIEDVLIALDKIKGDHINGEKIFMQQGCFACHSYKANQIPKGPNMAAVGSVLSKEEIAMSILRPNDSISQGFHSIMIQTKKGQSFNGFVTKEQDGMLELRTITGQVHQIKTNKIAKRETLKQSMMPAGLANGLSLKEFASLIDWLKKNKG